MRTLVIGDIHGCLRALTALLDQVAPGPDDRLITLGDYVDRGPNSRGVLDRLVALDAAGRLTPLLGNHDQMMIEVFHGGDPRIWLSCGGPATLRSYGLPVRPDPDPADVPQSHWDFLRSRCVLLHEMENHFCVHANVLPDRPLALQPEYVLLWDKLVPERSVPHVSGKVMLCGHTRQDGGALLDLGHAICLDTAACAGGWLTCLEVETGRWWQARETGEVRCGRLTRT